MERLIFALATGLLCTTAAANDNYHYVCAQESATRIIEVAYLVPEQSVPCEVRYQKDSGESEVLWRADNQEGFCENKAKQMIKQQEQWGFDCASDNQPQQTTSPSRY